jgi:hypothetical protein
MNNTIQDISLNYIKTRKRDKKQTSDSCQELKNIEYKTMLINGHNIKTNIQDYSNNFINDFLNKETSTNNKETWTKLDKTQRIKLLVTYSETLRELHNLTTSQHKILEDYLKTCLERKVLNKTKDVIYNKNTGLIDNIPNLIFNEDAKVFNMKKSDKHVSTIKSLAPKKNNKTIRNDKI